MQVGQFGNSSYSFPSVDTIAPSILSCPNNITTQVDPGNLGTTVNWEEPRVEDISGDVMLLVQTHAPGTFFAIGTTIVSYIYRDNANNMAKCSFLVTVKGGKNGVCMRVVRMMVCVGDCGMSVEGCGVCGCLHEGNFILKFR